MIRVVLAAAAALVLVAGGIAVFGLALVVTRPFPDEHNDLED